MGEEEGAAGRCSPGAAGEEGAETRQQRQQKPKASAAAAEATSRAPWFFCPRFPLALFLRKSSTGRALVLLLLLLLTRLQQRARTPYLYACCSPADGLGRRLVQRRRGPHESQRRGSPGRGDPLDRAVAFRFLCCRFCCFELLLLARALPRRFGPRLGGGSRCAPRRGRGAGPRGTAGAGGGAA